MLVLLLLFITSIISIFFTWNFYIQIALNIILIFIVIMLSNIHRYRIRKKLFRLKNFGNPIKLGLYIGALQVTLFIAIGFILGFGLSPYSHEFPGIIINLLFVTSLIISHEFARSYLLCKFKRHEWCIPVVVAIFTAIYIPPNLIYLQKNPLEILKYTGSTLIPTIVQQLFATILVYYSGAYASIVYFGVLKGFNWFSPVLPKTGWMLKSLIESVTPVIGYLILSNETTAKKIKIKKERSDISWIITIVICMLILLFFTGKFGYHPAIVGSGSMSPTICTGDIVIIKKVNPSTLKVGDIIQYRTGKGFTITHRIIAIKNSTTGLIFITKGDANNIPDKPFKSTRIVGKVVFVIPKIGLIPLMIRNLIWEIMKGGG